MRSPEWLSRVAGELPSNVLSEMRWIDVIAGEPVPDDFFCLRAASLPPASVTMPASLTP